MIYAFLSDEAFAVTGTESVSEYTDVISNELGMIDDNLLNYFVKHTVVSDPVGTESTVRPSRLHVDNSTTAKSKPDGRMLLHLDNDSTIVTDGSKERAFIDALTIGEYDSEEVRLNKVKLRGALFNIMEASFFAHKSASSSYAVYKADELNSMFVAESGSTYAGYVAGSVAISSGVTRSSYRYFEGTSTTSITGSIIDFYNYVTFTFQYGSASTDIVEVKAWLSVPDFKTNYPYSTITDVVYPCKATWIYNPTDSGGQVEAVINAANYKDAVLNDAVTKRDHSGIGIYTSRYINTGVSSNARMSFITMYKGSSPTTRQMQVAIRTKLLAEGIAGESEWKAILPDLFVDATFYIIPCYFQRVAYPNSTIIERSLATYRLLYDKMKQLFTDYDTQDLFDYMELLQAPGHKMYLMGLPENLGEQMYTSIKDLHPTYQAIDSVGIAYTYQLTTDTVYSDSKSYYYRNGSAPLYEYTLATVTSEMVGQPIPANTVYERIAVHDGYWNTMTNTTKEFAQLLANCMTVCLDESSSFVTDYTKEDILLAGAKRTFYTFVTSSVEYKMLSLRGAADILDTEDVTREDCEHVAGYIH